MTKEFDDDFGYVYKVNIQKGAYRGEVELGHHLQYESPAYADQFGFDNYIPETSQEVDNLRLCKRFAERFVTREKERITDYFCNGNIHSNKNALGLILSGKCGTGKTHLALAMLNVLDENKLPGIYFSTIDLFDRLARLEKRDEVESVFKILRDQPCLILDDVGAFDCCGQDWRWLRRILVERVAERNPTVLVTNLSVRENDELQRFLGGNLYQKVMSVSYPLIFTGRNRFQPPRCSAEEVF